MMATEPQPESLPFDLGAHRSGANHLAIELSRYTGESVTQAVIVALCERLEREKRRGQPSWPRNWCGSGRNVLRCRCWITGRRMRSLATTKMGCRPDPGTRPKALGSGLETAAAGKRQTQLPC